MIENKILEVFYEQPEKEFTVREIARSVRIPRATVHKYMVDLKKQKLITQENKANNNLYFRTKKINFFIEKIVASGLIEYIIDKLNPSCIILFGSVRKGESIKESDIDIFIESSIKKYIDLKKYEKILKHPIQLIIENDINKINSNLFNNIVNGIKLYGNFNVKNDK